MIWVKRYLHCCCSNIKATKKNAYYPAYMGEILAHPEDIPSKGWVRHTGGSNYLLEFCWQIIATISGVALCGE